MLLLVLSLACSEDSPQPTIDLPPVDEIPVVDLDQVDVEADQALPGDEAQAEEATGEAAGEPAAEESAGTASPAVEEKTTKKAESTTAPANPVAIGSDGEDAVAEAGTAAEEAVLVAAPAPTVRYALTPDTSSIYVQVYKDPSTAAAGLSHDHVMVASKWTGSATWNVDDLSQCSIQITVPVNDLVVDPPRMREAVGYDTTLEDGQRADVRKNMLSKDQLWGEKYPEITFVSTRCEASGDKVLVVGQFTVRGTTNSISTKMTVTATETSFSALGGFKAKGSDYGLMPFTAMLGALKNQDEMKYTVSVKGTAK